MAKYPTYRGQIFAAALNQARRDAGLIIKDVAHTCGVTDRTIRRGEAGAETPQRRLFERLMRTYRIRAEQRERLEHLWVTLQQQPWWNEFAFDDGSENFRHYLDLETHAHHVVAYNPTHIPAQLQVERYVFALFSKDYLTQDEADNSRRIRLARQANVIARDDPPKLDFLIDSLALQRSIGGDSIMAEQLDHLLRLTSGRHPNITIRLIPQNRYPIEAVAPEFSIFHTAFTSSPVLILGSGTTPMTAGEENPPYAWAIPEHIENLALTPAESRTIIEDHARAYRDRIAARRAAAATEPGT